MKHLVYPLTQTTLYEADGFSLSLTCQVSSSAQERELQAWSPPGQTSCMPESVRQAMLDRLDGEAKKMLCEAHPRLLAGLVAVACDYQSKLNEKTIVDEGGAV